MPKYSSIVRSLPSLAILAMISSQAAGQSPAQPTESSCRTFAQQFYDWYVPLTKKKTEQPASDLALQRKAEVFVSDLLKALKIDSEASAHAKGDIVGLDFDPFLGGQDPAGRYEARRVTLQGSKCSVEVWGVLSRGTAKIAKPDVIADLTLDHGNWQFSNFRYPDVNADLVSVLRQLREERQKH